MIKVPWKDVQNDIKNTLSGYNCTVIKEEVIENPDCSVFCDFRVTFIDPDSIADFDEIINKLERDENNWGWRIDLDGLDIHVSVVFRL